MKSMKKGISSITDTMSSLSVQLILLGIVLVGAVYAYYKLTSTNEVTLMTNIVNETRSMRASNGYGTSDYVPALISSDSISKNYNVTDSKIYNKSGGLVTVTGNGLGFTIVNAGLPRRDCMKVAQSIGSADLSSTKINSTSISGEVTAVDAASACVDGSNTLTFTTKS
ncbi:type 4 pilus major pilin [Erwinia rhapontici]|uniref:type 4 pilus major pilin n=1 Tax=Erwinia rhapontici TaxID=55212 RepID=UPI00133156E7|nr:type 4 pilus major pilin [Erwinia rhapontici]MBP2157391.1 hypothetical protein [Erwinia rhapontici]